MPVLKIRDGETRIAGGKLGTMRSRSPRQVHPNILRYHDDPTPMAIVPNVITADEVNCLIYSYLKDSGTLKVLSKSHVLNASV